MSGGRRIILATDLSSYSSERMLNYIKKKILRKGDKVIILHVFNWQNIADLPMDDEVMGIGSGNLIALNNSEKKRAREEIGKGMESLLKKAQEYDVDAESIILEGYPRIKICELAAKKQADFVIMASRGMGALGRLFLGSVSD
mmetsp:Transcript_16720/g.23393  ORF Transcript_16720/g.23393 Transcript_16720/m.23393 type:complete len:143 (-) Transcript_16720:119-547(-)